MDFNNKKIMIIGAGKSGIAAAGLLAGSGADITLYDDRGDLDIAEIKKKIAGNFTGRIALADIPAECRTGLDYLILSPGVPIDTPFVQLVRSRGTKVIGEVELAYYFSKGKITAVTGTNGKTTTTALTGHILSYAFDNTIVVGNIGIPYTEEVLKTTDDGMTVAEMSSFQLDTIETFRPNVSMVLNITPDHLDRHHTMRNYINAKFNIARNQKKGDICILNYEDATLREMAETLNCDIVWFSSAHKLDDGLYLDGNVIRYASHGSSTPIIDVRELAIIGTHNYENVMAAIAAAMYFNVEMDKLIEALKSFKPVEHRIEYVATKNGVKYYNDSKGTNPDASIKAVLAMPSPAVVIGGGYDKGSEYDEWIDTFEGRVKHLVLMGQTRFKIAECARKHGFEAISFVESMEEAVELCAKLAEPGETVLLSPCCASWGMFANYEERGRIFKELVRALPDKDTV